MAPAMHPQAKFDPIPPDLDLHALVDRTSNFEWVKRISAAQIRQIGPQEFEKLVLIHVIRGGKPLVIEKWNSQLPKSLFGVEWLEETNNKKQENVRDITNQTDIPMTTGHYLRSMKQLTNQWTPSNFRDERRQRLYLKDIDCPDEWRERLQKLLPPNLFYMNENVEKRSGRRNDEADMFDEPQSAAPAGDLMSSLPENMRAANLMCYIGHEGTYTPAHKEMCASLGQNIMVDTSGEENGEKPGSSIWFMTESKDRDLIREYFLSMLGHDIEIEKHFAQINAWKKATFPVYVVEQRLGDLILIPPLAPHQVWNRGTRTIKVAWNRTTAETLEMALHEALPRARLVCRDEQYKNKAIIYFTLQKYYREMMEMEATAEMGWLGIGQDLIRSSSRAKQMAHDFRALFSLFTEVLVDEMFVTKEREVEFIEFDSFITCSYCRANVFNRFLTCKRCVRPLINGDEDTYDVCMECYAMGRSCLCVSGLTWCEQWKWAELVNQYESWRAMIVKNDGFVDLAASPLPLELARRRFGKRSVAQICQEQLRRRPFKDIAKVEEQPFPPEPDADADGEPHEIEVDDEGKAKKTRKKAYKRKRKQGDVYTCHVCCHKDYSYRLAFCTTPGCKLAYCYGVLYRAFDMMPQEVLQNERWHCPKCLNMCNCGACRRQGGGNPYVPRNTLLGHDTRPIADDRSVESLVDFRVHNLSWLKSSGDETRGLHSKRLQRLKQAAEVDKAKAADLASQAPILADRLDAATQQQSEATQSEATQSGLDDVRMLVSLTLNGEHGKHAQQQHNGALQDPSVAPTSGEEDQSAYPDPTMLGNERRLGMGYYEPDDAPDKILFDPYQAPQPEVFSAQEPEVSEYVKKQLRAAKRRARQEEDKDPDFTAPRTHHRKKPRLDNQGTAVDGQAVALSNMDPALFGDEDTIPLDAPLVAEDAPADAEGAGPFSAASGSGSAQEEEEGDQSEEHRPHSPNRPALRHARPKISYTEADGGDDEEFSETLLPKAHRPQRTLLAPAAAPGGVAASSADPLDLASAAIRTLTRVGVSLSAESGADGTVGVIRKRGRPSRPPASRPHWADAVPAAEAPAGPRQSRGSRPSLRARGRPKQRSNGPPRRRGRPRKSSVTRGSKPGHMLDGHSEVIEVIKGGYDATVSCGRDSSAVPSEKMKSEHRAFRIAVDKAVSEAHVGILSTVPKRRGRPPKHAGRPDTASSAHEPFMSMADRMRLKGKSFKIAERKSAPAHVGILESRSYPDGRPPPAPEKASTPPARESPRPRGSTTKKVSSPTPPFLETQPPESQTPEEAAPPVEGVITSSAATPELEPEPEPSPVASASPSTTPSPPAAKGPVYSPSRPTGPTVVRIGESYDEIEGAFSRSGPTVVRLMSSDEEEKSGSELGSFAASGTSFDDDDEIPSQFNTKGATSTRGRLMATRGGVRRAVRGGRIRGRSRGRAR